MADQGGAEGWPTRSFADRLNYLFDTVHPVGRKPYSNPEVAEAISATGVSISGAYIWLLRTGQRDNPTLRHLEALAKFFGVSAAYFLDAERAGEIAEQLELLAVVRDADIREIALRSAGLSKPDRLIILGIVKRFAGECPPASPQPGRKRRGEAAGEGTDSD